MSPDSEIKPRSRSIVNTLDEMALIECIDEGLGVLGRDDQRKVYWRMLLISKMKENGTSDKGILRDPEGFLKSIEDTFGIGAWAIERSITQEIKRRFELNAVESGSLVGVIKSAMHKISQWENTG
ncbi:MAG TPA: hypothetical protein VN739_02800 [Nitrososphaerales archaeon]|nr:hypothetical protein [Nitrososphaerales archaeon]